MEWKMKSVGILTLIITGICWSLAVTTPAKEPEKDFPTWLNGLRVEALDSGISRETVEKALSNIEAPLPRIVTLDRNQPEFTQSLEDYVSDRVNKKRIDGGREMMSRYPTWLGKIEREYGVQRRFLVALWGIESNYGTNTGELPVFQSLATLAYDGRRSDYFRREFINALHILDDGLIPLKYLKGSWAGAMGQCQFMPSSYRRFAVDATGEGYIDPWTTVPDVLASTANYLARAGWKNDQTWGRPVKLPKNFDTSLAGLDTRLPLSRWQAMGVRRSNGRALPRRDLKASLILPDGPGGPAYLVYDNFRALLSWNRSHKFAVAVGTLSDRVKTRQSN